MGSARRRADVLAESLASGAFELHLRVLSRRPESQNSFGYRLCQWVGVRTHHYDVGRLAGHIRANGNQICYIHQLSGEHQGPTVRRPRGMRVCVLVEELENCQLVTRRFLSWRFSPRVHSTVSSWPS